MSAPVDVLAVMDATADYLGLTPGASSAPLRQARAAIAEMIEALRVVAAGNTDYEDLQEIASGALARVGGGK